MRALLPLLLLTLAVVADAAWPLIRPAAAEAALHRFARRVDLPVLPEVHDEAVQRVRARAASGLVGAVGSGAVAAAWWVATGTGHLSAAGFLAVAAMGVTGMATARAVDALRSTTPLDTETPRVARGVRLSLRDYVQPLELIGARALVGLAVGLSAAGLALTSSGTIDVTLRELVPSLAFVLMAVLALAAAELVGRRIVGRTQHARTPLELAWDDALRAMTLRDVVTVPLCLAGWSCYLFMFALSDYASSHAVNGSVGVGTMILSAGIVTIAIVSASQHPARHFRARLWPGRTIGHASPVAATPPAAASNLGHAL